MCPESLFASGFSPRDPVTGLRADSHTEANRSQWSGDDLCVTCMRRDNQRVYNKLQKLVVWPPGSREWPESAVLRES